MARPNPDCPSYFIKQLSLGDTRIGHGSTGKSRGRGGLPALRTRGALSYYVPQDLFSLLPDGKKCFELRLLYGQAIP